MNNCILNAEIVQNPQLRYTSDTQTPVAEMLVQFDPLRPGDPVETLKVVGWGNLAQEIQERCHQGDRILIEGRLSMSTFDRPEGFKEKRVELTAQRIHFVSESGSESLTGLPSSGSQGAATAPPPARSATPPKVSEPAPASADYDDIPF